MSVLQQDEQSIIIAKSLEIFKDAPLVLQNNQIRKDKAIAVGQNILNVIQNEGMSEELDNRCQTYLANINTAAKEFKENRTGITQIMDNIKKMYTSVENEIDIKNPDTVPGMIQAHRNEYVKKVAEEKERKRQELERERRKKEEAIEIRSLLNSFITNSLITFISNKKQKMTAAFNAITLEDYDIKASALKGMPTAANMEEMKSKVNNLYNFPFHYLTREEVDAIGAECKDNYDWAGFAAKYQDEILAYKTELADKLPSKLNELQEQKRLKEEAEAAAAKAKKEAEERQAAMEKANAEEKKRLEEEARLAKIEEDKRLAELKSQQEKAEKEKAEREAAEQQKIEAEAAEAAKRAREEEEIKKQGEVTMNMFEQEAQLAVLTETPEVREGYTIKVSHPVGYTQIFAFWFEKEGKNLPMEKIEKTSIAQMKAWAEKIAHKTDEKLNSQFISYEPSYKAVNRKQS